MLATVVYSVVAGWTLGEIHTGAADTHTLAVAADSQARTLRQELIAHEGAIVHITPQVENGNVREGLNTVILHIRNNSPSVASKFHGRFNIVKQTVPDGKIIWKSDDFEFGAEDMEATPAAENRGIDPKYSLNLSQRDMALIEDMRMTIGVKGTLYYWNGFETVNPALCFTYLYWLLKDKTGFVVSPAAGDFHSCSEYNSQVHTWFTTKRDWEKKEWPGQKPKPN